VNYSSKQYYFFFQLNKYYFFLFKIIYKPSVIFACDIFGFICLTQERVDPFPPIGKEFAESNDLCRRVGGGLVARCDEMEVSLEGVDPPLLDPINTSGRSDMLLHKIISSFSKSSDSSECLLNTPP